MNIQLPSRKRLTALLVAVALVATGTGFLIAPAADALPTCGTHVKIYDNCIDCNQIGFRYYDCDGVLQVQWGVQSSSCMHTVTYCCIEY